ncbi:MAG: lactonase family protein [Lachnospiraceae bacterium]|nr:lactonase family protein [Lachnospiraceae bacterium]
MSNSQITFACIGAWGYRTDEPEHGFTICVYDPQAGTFTPTDSILPYIRVGGTCLHPTLPVLYCTDECFDSHPEGGGQILALRLHSDTGAAEELSRLPSFGCAPSYCAIDTSGKTLLVSNHAGNGMITRTEQDGSGCYHLVRQYDEANVTLFPLREDGSIAPPCDIVRLTKITPHGRRKHPMPHSVMASPDGKVFLVCDFGSDMIYTFTIDYETGKLVMTNSGAVFQGETGSAPRYSTFHPSKPYVNTNNEDTPYVYSFRYQPDGQMRLLGKTAAVAPDAPADQLPLISDIRIHPTGRWVYNLSRAYNTVTVLAVDEDTGILSRQQILPLSGDFPKGCCVSPDGRFLHIAMKKSGEVLTYPIAGDGSLLPLSHRLEVLNAANITFFPI